MATPHYDRTFSETRVSLARLTASKAPAQVPADPKPEQTMRHQHLWLASAALACAATIVWACMPYPRESSNLSNLAVSNDPAVARRATILLRAMGQTGLDELIAAYS